MEFFGHKLRYELLKRPYGEVSKVEWHFLMENMLVLVQQVSPHRWMAFFEEDWKADRDSGFMVDAASGKTPDEALRALETKIRTRVGRLYHLEFNAGEEGS